MMLRCLTPFAFFFIDLCLGSQERRPLAKPQTPSRILWVILSVILFFIIFSISVVVIFSFTHRTTKNHQGSQMNQSAFVDKSKNTVTYHVTSPSNHTTVVLFDSKNGYVCYKLADQNACYLRKMDDWDLENVQISFNLSEHRVNQLLLQNNQTKYYREFLGILPGRQANARSLGEAIQTLCEQTSIYWVRKGDGPGKKRLIYLCIDICFPSNVCLSVCFYYLPD
ncbi:BRICHOS domain-containing protein 5 isoform X3 [Gopherus evgoodei]|uniref:BRICHOS domain-containing protein 5 isoform X3 n=1 Tax=Gopherus evgoodei TaxID=1825980 RepID=UPI0011D000AC|nr:BRICHOS domain-containing protein 5 isoform X3 [Gopherus evgoodei]